MSYPALAFDIDRSHRSRSELCQFHGHDRYQPELVGHRVWSGERQIEERLAELAHHAEDILQVNLRDRYDRIEDYNAIAGSMFEPYRAVAAIGFPDNLTREGYRYLRGLIDSGRRCGTFVLLVCDSSRLGQQTWRFRNHTRC